MRYGKPFKFEIAVDNLCVQDDDGEVTFNVSAKSRREAAAAADLEHRALKVRR